MHFDTYNKVTPSCRSYVGKNGFLRLELAANAHAMSSTLPNDNPNFSSGPNDTICAGSKTFIKSLLSRPPLLVQKALYPNVKFPGMAHIYIMSSAGGILQGDRVNIEVIAGEASFSHITTQAATKIYKMEEDCAIQNIDISLGNNCYLEFMPEELIPYKSSRFFQQVNLKLGSGSTIVYSEIISAGRIASGEIFEFDSCFLRTICHDKNNKVIFLDSTKIEPTKSSKGELHTAFDNKTILSTIFIVTKSIEYEKLGCEISKAINCSRNMSAGYSSLPHQGGAIVRTLSNSIDQIRNFNIAIANAVRTLVLYQGS